MPGLYAAATHYWSMTHGEGRDQPMTEAAASGLRLIAPDHTAYRTYLDPSAGTLLRCTASRLDVAEADQRNYRSLFLVGAGPGGLDGRCASPSRAATPDGDCARADAITAHDRPSEQISKVGQTGRSRYGAGPKSFRLAAMPAIRASRMAVVISRKAVWTAVCFAKRQPASSERRSRMSYGAE
jgi:hypothetical protein